MTTASITSNNNQEEEKNPVAIPCIGYEVMSEDWALIHDLLGGTKAMQKAGTKWLPMEAAESITSYDARLTRSILFNGYRDTTNKLKNRPFTRSMIVKDIPEDISYLKMDVDGNGKTLETFAKDILENLIRYGIAHIFVAHSRLPEIEDGVELTIKDEREAGARVFLINMSPVDLIGWQTKRDNGQTVLTQIRQREITVEPVGDYGDSEAEYINVYNVDSWETWQQDPEKPNKYELIEKGESNFGAVPLVTIYANRTGYMTADPPLMDLAWLNLAHWQSYSDQRHILRFSRFGLIFGKGLPEKLVKKGSLEIGPTKAYLVTNTEADMKYVEHSGKAIEAGQRDIEDIETKMRVLGNQPLIKETPNTATAEKLDENRTVSQLQSWVRSLERGLTLALRYACRWRAIEPPEDIGVEIYNDFEANILGGTDKELLLKMRMAGEITAERFLKEVQRRAVLSEDMDPVEEAKNAAAEAGSDLKNFMPEEDDETEEGGALESMDEE